MIVVVLSLIAAVFAVPLLLVAAFAIVAFRGPDAEGCPVRPTRPKPQLPEGALPAAEENSLHSAA